jgi:hypothetical protein
MITLTSAIQASFSGAGAKLVCVMQRLPLVANHRNPIREMPAQSCGPTTVSRPKMIKTFSLSALFFLSLGLLIVNAAQLPIA